MGTQDPASSAPGLPSIESAWICRYIPLDVGPDPGGNGTTYGWLRAGPVVPVPATEVPGLESLLSALRPVTYDGFCTADLGRRYMLVFSHGKDLTGVALDDFGCSDARLTDEPFTTVLGESTQPGIVPGVFRRSEDLLAEVKDLYPDA